jgi:hypothetical protein
MTSKASSSRDADEFQIEVDPGSQTEAVAHELIVTITGFNSPRYAPECVCGWSEVGYANASEAQDAYEAHQ